MNDFFILLALFLPLAAALAAIIWIFKEEIESVDHIDYKYSCVRPRVRAITCPLSHTDDLGNEPSSGDMVGVANSAPIGPYFPTNRN